MHFYATLCWLPFQFNVLCFQKQKMGAKSFLFAFCCTRCAAHQLFCRFFGTVFISTKYFDCNTIGTFTDIHTILAIKCGHSTDRVRSCVPIKNSYSIWMGRAFFVIYFCCCSSGFILKPNEQQKNLFLRLFLLCVFAVFSLRIWALGNLPNQTHFAETNKNKYLNRSRHGFSNSENEWMKHKVFSKCFPMMCFRLCFPYQTHKTQWIRVWPTEKRSHENCVSVRRAVRDQFFIGNGNSPSTHSEQFFFFQPMIVLFFVWRLQLFLGL